MPQERQNAQFDSFAKRMKGRDSGLFRFQCGNESIKCVRSSRDLQESTELNAALGASGFLLVLRQ